VNSTEDVLMLAGAIVATAVLGWLTGRLARGDGPRGLPLGDETRDGFWRRTLPWPTGVQEDSEIAWHVPPTAAAVPPVRSAASAGERHLPVPPTRPQGRFVGR
jgi:hypothetical protein